MKTFTEPLKELKEFETLSAGVHDLRGIAQISGCIDAAKPHIMYSVNNGSGNRIIVTFQEQRAKEIYEEYRFFDPKAAYYPAKDILFYQSDIRGNVLTAERINALKMLAEESSCTIITTFDGLMNPMPMPEKFIREVKKVSVGDILNLEELTKHLVELGYEKNYQAETMGEFSVRGGILDIFPLTEDNPFRIEFWGDEVDSIRSFDAESQRSIENLEEISIYPACELVLTAEERQEGIKRILKEADKVSAKLRKEMKTEEAHRTKSAAAQIAEEAGELGISAGLDAYLSYFCEERVSLLDYFNRENTVIFVDELARSIERGMVTETEFSESMKQRLEKGYILPGQMRELFSCKEILAKMEKMACISLVALDLKNSHVDIKEKFVIDSKTVNPYNNSFDLLVKDLTRYKKNGYRVILLSGSRTRAKRLAEDLMAEELNAFYSEDFDHEVKPGEIMTGYGKIKKGYEYPLLKFVVISESDIFGSEKKKKKHHRTYEGEKIASFTIDHIKLQPGVYVSRKDKVGGSTVTTFDLRMTSPNEEPVMNTAEMHTIEHLGATFLRNHKDFGDKTVYFGPMGCRTGFYLLLAGDYESKDILPLVVEMYEFVRDFEGEVPGASPKDCGNYLDMNLGMAKYLAAKYLKVLTHIDEFPESRLVYPE